MFDYKVKRTEDCILVATDKWIQTSLLDIRKLKGSSSITYVTEILDFHIHSDIFKDLSVKVGDYALITKVSAEIIPMRGHSLEDDVKYFDLPITQVLGTFKNREISYDSLTMIYDKILIEKINLESENTLSLSTNETIGKIVKIGTTGFTKDWKPKPLRVKVGDIVIVKDNVITPVHLNGKDYFGIEERAIVGIYDTNTKEIEFINESILMKPYISDKVLNSSLLVNPSINYEDLDYSDVYNRDLFQIEYLDKEISNLKVKDIILVKRDYTNYVYLNQEKFFLLNGKDWIECKIEL